MPRRALALSVVLAFVFLTPALSHGQQPGKVYRIGCFDFAKDARFTYDAHQCPMGGRPGYQAWIAGLRDYGYILGQNVVLECRDNDGREDQAPVVAAELVRLNPDLIVINASAVNVVAAQRATRMIRIVMVDVVDPVGRGLVPSLAHPGGNTTELANMAGVGIMGKQVQVITEALPQVARVTVLSYAGGVPTPGFQEQQEATARDIHVTLQRYPVRVPEDLPGAYAAMTTARAQGLVTESYMFMTANRQRIIELAAQYRLPTVFHNRLFADDGGLMAYGRNTSATYRRIGYYVDKILHGANPGDLPVEQPTKFELVINLKTAKDLRLTIPQSLLNRADEVIE